MFLTADYDYHLPDELIASRPADDRAASRMLVVHRATGRIEHRMFREFPSFLTPGDLLVLNDTKVIPARDSPTTDGSNCSASTARDHWSGAAWSAPENG